MLLTSTAALKGVTTVMAMRVKDVCMIASVVEESATLCLGVKMETLSPWWSFRGIGR